MFFPEDSGGSQKQLRNDPEEAKNNSGALRKSPEIIPEEVPSDGFQRENFYLADKTYDICTSFHWSFAPYVFNKQINIYKITHVVKFWK